MHVTFCCKCQPNCITKADILKVSAAAKRLGLIEERHMVHCGHHYPYATRISKINGRGRMGDTARLEKLYKEVWGK